MSFSRLRTYFITTYEKTYSTKNHDELYTFKEGDVIDAAYLEARMNEAARAYQQEITILQSMTPDEIGPSLLALGTS